MGRCFVGCGPIGCGVVVGLKMANVWVGWGTEGAYAYCGNGVKMGGDWRETRRKQG